MADATQNTGIQRHQGGNGLSVTSGSSLVIDSGGSLTNAGTETLSGTVSLTGTMSVSTTGLINLPVTTNNTTSGTLPNFGVISFGSTLASVYSLTNPTAGGQRVCLCVTAQTTIGQVVRTASTACTIVGTTSGPGVTLRTLTFPTGGSAAELVSLSSTAWFLLVNTGTVVLSS